MAHIIEDGSNIILQGEEYNLKIDSNRHIYVKKPTDSIYNSIEYDVPYGLDKEAKKRFLAEFYEKLEYKRKLREQQKEDQQN